MNIAEAASLTGLSIDTIRYYERATMLPSLPRDTRGWRHFDPPALDWLKILERLRATGMPMAEMRRFAQLVFDRNDDAQAAMQERLEILALHRKRLAQKRAELAACERFVDMKIRMYSADLEALNADP
ncbi:MAG: MerR family transcriptional regulator [bacterium]